GDRKNQPPLSDSLHPGAGIGKKRSRPEQSKIAMTKGAEHFADAAIVPGFNLRSTRHNKVNTIRTACAPNRRTRIRTGAQPSRLRNQANERSRSSGKRVHPFCPLTASRV